MSNQPTSPNQTSNPNKTYVIGSMLILMGILFFVEQVVQSPYLGMLIIPGLGLIFIVWALLLRSFGLLVPGGILLGVGVGSMLAGSFWPADLGIDAGASFQIAFGLGWVLITLLSPLTTGGFQWWPLIPGGILLSIGLLILAGEWGGKILTLSGYLWPLALVALGIYLIFTHTRKA